MRGKADTQVAMLTLITADQLVPEDHPIRQIKPIVDKALAVSYTHLTLPTILLV